MHRCGEPSFRFVRRGFFLHHYNTYRVRTEQTCLRVLRQAVISVLIIVAAAAIPMNLDPVRQIGTGLLASAGVAGVVLGLGAKESLSMTIAGLQIGLTNPMKIDDVVIVESEYGEMEEINLTYVVVRA
jgi:small-conductance mechanosensitive channel